MLIILKILHNINIRKNNDGCNSKYSKTYYRKKRKKSYTM